MFSLSSYAEERAYQQLLNAITVCPENENPMILLKQSGSNSFGQVEFEDADETIVTAALVSNPGLTNILIMAPTRLMGKMKLEMSYPRPGHALRCIISYSK